MQMLAIALLGSISYGMIVVRSYIEKDSKLVSQSATIMGSNYDLVDWNKDVSDEKIDQEFQKLRTNTLAMIDRNDETEQTKFLQIIMTRYEKMSSYIWSELDLTLKPAASAISNVTLTGSFVFGVFVGVMLGHILCG